MIAGTFASPLALFPSIIVFIVVSLSGPRSPAAVLGCAPPPPSGHLIAAPRQQQSGHLLFGERTHQASQAAAEGEEEHGNNAPAAAIVPVGHPERASTLSGPIRDTEELFCYDFNEKCRWRNMEGLLVDELDWYQGAGNLDENRLRLATGTHLTPDGFYGIAATDKVEFAGTKAILVSDVIECQEGTAELRFMYWTSPEVQITICVKSVLRLFPYYNYCTKPIENNDPGPAHVILPDLEREPMQIFIQAHNFVFNSAALQGGFAIIDNLEYYGELCQSADGTGSAGWDFASAKTAPVQSAARLREQHQQTSHFLEQGTTTREEQRAAAQSQSQSPSAAGTEGPYEGFRSLMEWMLYGAGGLGRQQQQQIGGTRQMMEQSVSMLTNGQMGMTMAAAAIGGTTTMAPTILSPDNISSSPAFPRPHPMAPASRGHQQQQQLGLIRVVQRSRATGAANATDHLTAAGGGDEEQGQQLQQEQQQLEPEDIRRSLLVNGEQPAQVQIRRAQPHLELLRRRSQNQRKRMDMGTTTAMGAVGGAEDDEQREEEEGQGEEEEEEQPRQVEREEWLGR